MKKILLILTVVLGLQFAKSQNHIFHYNYSYGVQQDVYNFTDNTKPAGQYNQSVGQYSLGWYALDPSISPGAEARLSGWGGIKMYTGGTPRISILKGGQVGIGTTTPFSKLTIDAGAVGAQKIKTNKTFIDSNGQTQTINAATSKEYNLGVTTKVTSNRSGYTAYNYNDYLNNAKNNAHFLSLFPHDNNSNNNDLSWKAFRLQGGETLEDRFWVNKLGGGYFAENLAIGTTHTGDYMLAVAGKITAKEIKVQLPNGDGSWPDYVFTDNYKLPTLESVEQQIKEKGHLKNIPSAQVVSKEGFYLGEMNAKLLEKIEELTLYTIQQDKQIKEQEARLEKLEKLLLDK